MILPSLGFPIANRAPGPVRACPWLWLLAFRLALALGSNPSISFSSLFFLFPFLSFPFLVLLILSFPLPSLPLTPRCQWSPLAFVSLTSRLRFAACALDLSSPFCRVCVCVCVRARFPFPDLPSPRTGNSNGLFDFQNLENSGNPNILKICPRFRNVEILKPFKMMKS